MMSELTIYVLPSEPNLPPRAVIGTPFEVDGGLVLAGEVVTWSTDSGTWTTSQGLPVPNDLAESITAHAKELGVEQFID